MRSTRIRRVAVLFALAIRPLGASGQQGSGALTLAQVYRLADIASPAVQATYAAARAADARVPGSRRLPDPQVQLQLMNRNLPGFGLNDPLGMNQLQVMQMLPLAGKLTSAGRIAQTTAEAAHMQVVEAAWSTRSAAAMAFFELHRLDTTIAVSRASLRLLSGIDSTTVQMYATGLAQQTDVLRAQLEISRMTAEIDEMTSMREAMAARLNAILNRASAVPVGQTELPQLPDSIPPTDSLLIAALRARGMLRAGEASVRAATLSEQLARKEIWPDLQVGVTYGQRPMPDGRTDRMLSLMLGASVPIWAGSRQYRMRDEASAMREMAEAELAAARAETRGRVMELTVEFDRTRRLRHLYTGSILPQAEATVLSARNGYQAGTVSFMALLDAFMVVNGYREKLQQLDAEAGTALAELEMLLGVPLIPGNPPVTPRGTGGPQ